MSNKLLGIVFLCVIMLVPLITIADRSFFNKDAETGNTAEISPIAAVGEFLDDIPFRKSLAKFNTKLTGKITNNMYINSTQVMLGKNDWLFLRETKQDFEHVNCFAESEKEQITKQLLKLNAGDNFSKRFCFQSRGFNRVYSGKFRYKGYRPEDGTP